MNIQLLYAGDNSAVAVAFEAAFAALSPVSTSTVAGIAYGDIYSVGVFLVDGPVCRKKVNGMGYPNSFSRWDVAGMPAAAAVFAELTADATFVTSVWLLESYGQRGVRAPAANDDNAVDPEERAQHPHLARVVVGRRWRARPRAPACLRQLRRRE